MSANLQIRRQHYEIENINYLILGPGIINRPMSFLLVWTGLLHKLE